MRLLLGTAAAALAVMLLSFVAGLIRKRHDGVDVSWGLGFAVVALTGLALSGGNGLLITALTVVWGLRLATHIALRQRGAPPDQRYVDLLDGHGPLGALRKVYLTQGVVLWFVSLPVLVAQQWGSFSWWALIGVAIWLVGMVFETVGDAQLARFRRDPANKGTVLNTGLWRYTRHPNYFGDACVWWGLFAVAAVDPVGWLTVLSPAVMTFLLARGTGKPLMEKHLSARPGYADYVARTSGFLPRPPR